MASPGFPRRWQEVLQPDDGVVKSCPAPVGGPVMATREGEAGGTPPVRAMGPLRAAARRVEDVLEEAQHLSMQMVAQQVRAANHPPRPLARGADQTNPPPEQQRRRRQNEAHGFHEDMLRQERLSKVQAHDMRLQIDFLEHELAEARLRLELGGQEVLHLRRDNTALLESERALLDGRKGGADLHEQNGRLRAALELLQSESGRAGRLDTLDRLLSLRSGARGRAHTLRLAFAAWGLTCRSAAGRVRSLAHAVLALKGSAVLARALRRWRRAAHRAHGAWLRAGAHYQRRRHSVLSAPVTVRVLLRFWHALCQREAFADALLNRARRLENATALEATKRLLRHKTHACSQQRACIREQTRLILRLQRLSRSSWLVVKLLHAWRAAAGQLAARSRWARKFWRLRAAHAAFQGWKRQVIHSAVSTQSLEFPAMSPLQKRHVVKSLKLSQTITNLRTVREVAEATDQGRQVSHQMSLLLSFLHWRLQVQRDRKEGWRAKCLDLGTGELEAQHRRAVDALAAGHRESLEDLERRQGRTREELQAQLDALRKRCGVQERELGDLRPQLASALDQLQGYERRATELETGVEVPRLKHQIGQLQGALDATLRAQARLEAEAAAAREAEEGFRVAALDTHGGAGRPYEEAAGCRVRGEEVECSAGGRAVVKFRAEDVLSWTLEGPALDVYFNRGVDNLLTFETCSHVTLVAGLRERLRLLGHLTRGEARQELKLHTTAQADGGAGGGAWGATGASDGGSVTLSGEGLERIRAEMAELATVNKDLKKRLARSESMLKTTRKENVNIKQHEQRVSQLLEREMAIRVQINDITNQFETASSETRQAWSTFNEAHAPLIAALEEKNRALQRQVGVEADLREGLRVSMEKLQAQNLQLKLRSELAEQFRADRPAAPAPAPAGGDVEAWVEEKMGRYRDDPALMERVLRQALSEVVAEGGVPPA